MPAVPPASNARSTHPAYSKADTSLRFAECRALGHAWRHRAPIGVDDTHDDFRRPFGMSTGMVGYLSACSVCKTQRVKWVTRSGEVINRYVHPDGYERHGDDKLSSRQWRTTFVQSTFEDFTYFDQETQTA